AYNYDPVGNRNPLTQTYDAGNRLLDDGTYTYTYDHDGNMVTKQNKTTLETTTYTYNSEDQLIGVVTPAQTISYKYDALGRRIEKNVGGAITRYIYDGEDIIQELDNNNQVVVTYTYGPSIDEPIALDKAGQRYYYISDGLGSITALVYQNGNIAQTYRYDSFGNISSTGSLSQPYTYTGREYDSETGLYYYRARYMDPKTGRFLQQDPIWSKNLYPYVRNNPLNLIDPYGLWFIDINFTGGKGGTAGVQIGPAGIYPYGGVGYGQGGGVSVTLNRGNPSSGLAVTATGSGGTGVLGANISGSYTCDEGLSGSVGAGWGVGAGWAVTATYTYPLMILKHGDTSYRAVWGGHDLFEFEWFW
ncbi:MAG: RHS repeat-associated core domain-containing protein, partial [bacterium]|nr:RHS repeat-associated core domain-containing protein [bacterium]